MDKYLAILGTIAGIIIGFLLGLFKEYLLSRPKLNMMRTIIRSIWFWILFSEAVLLLFLHVIGFRITYDPKLETSWAAVGAVGQWASALVGLLIPFAAIYLQANLDKNKRDIGEANSELYNEFKNFKSEYIEKIKTLSKLVNEKGDIVIDGGNFDEESDLKERALKFINISMVTNTKRVADHLSISDDKAFSLLEEMVRHDESISCGGLLTRENMNNLVWTKKNKR